MNAVQPIMRNVAMPSIKPAFPVFLDHGDKRTWSPLVEEKALPRMRETAKKENAAFRRICNMSAPDVKASASEIRDVKRTAHEAIRAQPGITSKHLGAQMDVSDTRINQIVASLARSGHITRERDNVWSSYSLRITGLPLEVEGHKTRADVKAHAEKARRALIFIADNPGCRPPLCRQGNRGDRGAGAEGSLGIVSRRICDAGAQQRGHAVIRLHD